MRIDIYTKVILTIIALLLAVIALTPLVQPQPAMAQGSFSGVQMSGGGDMFFDTRTGDICAYEFDRNSPRFGQVTAHYKIGKLGQPLAH